jgi:MYXO-CTERM domain-containing protein
VQARQQIASGPVTATNLAFAPRGQVSLPRVIKRDLPEIDIRMGANDFGAPAAMGSDMAAPPAARPTAQPPKSGGCGCTTSGRNGAGSLALIIAACIVSRRRRKV